MGVCSVEGINSHAFNGIQIPKRNNLFSVLIPLKTLYSPFGFSFLAIDFWFGFSYEYLVIKFFYN